MNRFERILGKDQKNQVGQEEDQKINCPDYKTKTTTSSQSQPSQDDYWRAVLTNAFYLHYPGPDGDYKSAEPLRPLWVVLNALRERGAGLVRVKKVDGSEHFKLVQGAMPADEWERARGSLAGWRDQLMWLFTLSVMGIVGEEEIEKHRKIAMELLEDAARRMRERDGLAAEQLRLSLTG